MCLILYVAWNGSLLNKCGSHEILGECMDAKIKRAYIIMKGNWLSSISIESDANEFLQQYLRPGCMTPYDRFMKEIHDILNKRTSNNRNEIHGDWVLKKDIWGVKNKDIVYKWNSPEYTPSS